MSELDRNQFLNSGLTLVNCSLTNDPYCAFKRGGYYNITGDSMTGKSILTVQLFAEAANDEIFDEYAFHHDNPEDGVHLDIAEVFGTSTAERINEYASETAEEMYSKMKRYFKKGPCIGVVDSIDALTTLNEMKKGDEIAGAIEEGQTVAGVMSDGKARVNSSYLRQLMRPLRDSGSLLFIISQTRDSLGTGFTPKTRSGGRALRFYAQTELWLSNKKTLKKTVRGVEREVGHIIEFSVKKTRHSSHKSKVEVPLLNDYGFDDIGSCVDWLMMNKYWDGKKKINATEFGVELSRQDLIAYIEEKSSRYEKLRELVGTVWNDIRKALRPDRKKRYN